MNYDVYVIGCGLTGSVIARALACSGKKVCIFEKRGHIAGNLYDEKNQYGIVIQKYGPHAFHTTKKFLYDYLLQFGEWLPYRLTAMVYMNSKFTPSPFNHQTIDDYFTPQKAYEIKSRINECFPNKQYATIVELLESYDPVIKEYADYLYKYDYSLYTAKQWGIPVADIDHSVLRRVPVRFSYGTGYFNDEYQAIPRNGYTDIVRAILNNENITIKLNTNACDYLKIDNQSLLINGQQTMVPVIYTGALDELMEYRYGKLPYRSLRFEYETLKMDSFQNAPIVAYPQEPGYTRITEYKKLPVQNVSGVTTIAKEYPVQAVNTIEPYYPLLTADNLRIYEKYLQDVSAVRNLYVCGRLGDYKYYNMDETLERALQVCEKLI